MWDTLFQSCRWRYAKLLIQVSQKKHIDLSNFEDNFENGCETTREENIKCKQSFQNTPSTYFIDPKKMKKLVDHETIKWFWTQNHLRGNFVS